jgi:hypothetical protein
MGRLLLTILCHNLTSRLIDCLLHSMIDRSLPSNLLLSFSSSGQGIKSWEQRSNGWRSYKGEEKVEAPPPLCSLSCSPFFLLVHSHFLCPFLFLPLKLPRFLLVYLILPYLLVSENMMKWLYATTSLLTVLWQWRIITTPNCFPATVQAVKTLSIYCASPGF